jgi:N-acetylmuramoyl-L-alanine amidase
MKFPTSIRKKKSLRKAILREVFKENLKMVGEFESYHKNQKKTTAIFMIATMMVLAMTVIYVANHSSLPVNSLYRYPPRLADSSQPGPVTENDTGSIQMPPSTPAQYNAFLNNAQTPLSRIFGLKVKTIVIDPGHGGRDPGAVGRLGTREKNITLDIAHKLRERLRKFPEYRILMTREKDDHLSLEQRVAFANSKKADLFISIHVNYIPSKPSNIIETYYFGPNSDEKTLMLVEKENSGTQYTLSDFSGIIQKIGNTLKTQESGQLALYIQRSLYSNISRQSRNIENWGVRKAPFIVLLGVDIPSVLTEVTCLSDPAEEKKLNQEPYREEIAKFLEEGIVKYLNNNHNKPEVKDATGSITDQK